MSDNPGSSHETGTVRVKRGLAEMLKGGVIMDVVTPEQAKIAEDAGACAVMALERVPSDIRRDGARVLGDLRLLRRDHIHDHAALEHVGHAALDARRPGLRSVPRGAPGVACAWPAGRVSGTGCGTGGWHDEPHSIARTVPPW